jgi:hypothetical protein
MKLMAFSYGAVFCAIVATCGGSPAGAGGSQSTQGRGTPSSAPPVGMCTSLAPPKMTYPSSGATGVPDGNFQLTVSYSTSPANAFTPPALTSGSAGAVEGGAWTQGSAGSWTSQIPALAPAATYSVSVTNSACNQTYTLGTFTTK